MDEDIPKMLKDLSLEDDEEDIEDDEDDVTLSDPMEVLTDPEDDFFPEEASGELGANAWGKDDSFSFRRLFEDPGAEAVAPGALVQRPRSARHREHDAASRRELDPHAARESKQKGKQKKKKIRKRRSKKKLPEDCNLICKQAEVQGVFVGSNQTGTCKNCGKLVTLLGNYVAHVDDSNFVEPEPERMSPRYREPTPSPTHRIPLPDSRGHSASPSFASGGREEDETLYVYEDDGRGMKVVLGPKDGTPKSKKRSRSKRSSERKRRSEGGHGSESRRHTKSGRGFDARRHSEDGLASIYGRRSRAGPSSETKGHSRGAHGAKATAAPEARGAAVEPPVDVEGAHGGDGVSSPIPSTEDCEPVPYGAAAGIAVPYRPSGQAVGDSSHDRYAARGAWALEDSERRRSQDLSGKQDDDSKSRRKKEKKKRSKKDDKHKNKE